MTIGGVALIRNGRYHAQISVPGHAEQQLLEHDDDRLGAIFSESLRIFQ